MNPEHPDKQIDIAKTLKSLQDMLGTTLNTQGTELMKELQTIGVVKQSNTASDAVDAVRYGYGALNTQTKDMQTDLLEQSLEKLLIRYEQCLTDMDDPDTFKKLVAKQALRSVVESFARMIKDNILIIDRYIAMVRDLNVQLQVMRFKPVLDDPVQPYVSTTDDGHKVEFKPTSTIGPMDPLEHLVTFEDYLKRHSNGKGDK